MSLHLSVIAIRGDARTAMGEFFEDCDYALKVPPKTVFSQRALVEALRLAEARAVCFHNGWTTVIDPELVLMLEDDVLAGLSARFGTVLTMVCEASSGSYGFSCYHGGKQVRVLLVVDGETMDDTGAPLPEEKGTRYEKLFEDDIQRILAKLGYVYPVEEVPTGFVVYCLGAVAQTLEHADTEAPAVPAAPFRGPDPQAPEPAPTPEPRRRFWQA